MKTKTVAIVVAIALGVGVFIVLDPAHKAERIDTSPGSEFSMALSELKLYGDVADPAKRKLICDAPWLRDDVAFVAQCKTWGLR